MPTETWRVGSKVPLNVYAGERPVCQCHNREDATAIVAALNGLAARDPVEIGISQRREPISPKSWMYWYECPNCLAQTVLGSMSFCGGCGKALKWI